jgi:hypothetical protein
MVGYWRLGQFGPEADPTLRNYAREAEIVPDMNAIPAHRHSLGHIALSISSRNAPVLHLADAVLHPILMERPDRTPTVDLLAAHAIATPRLLLDRAAVDKPPVHNFRFPFPGLGHVVPLGKSERWEPVAQ